MTSDTSSSRSLPIDAARALSILVVVGFHLMMFGVSPSTVGSGAPVRMTFIGSPGPVGWALSWFVMVMPLFFVVGGFANAHVLERQRAVHAGYGGWLVARGRRLFGPLVLYILVWTTVGTVYARIGRFDTAVAGTLAATEVLWFLLVYLVVIVLTPAMCAAHDRWGVAVPVVLGSVAVALDLVRFVLGGHWAGYVNYLVVWTFVHQLGIAYHRGWWRTGPVARVWGTLVGAVLALLVLLFVVARYPLSAVGLGDEDLGNLAPPTAAMAVLALAQTTMLALVERRFGSAIGRSRRLRRVVERLNGLAVTIYLWHGPIIALAIGLVYPFALRFRPAAGILLGRPAILVLAVPLMLALIPVIGGIERHLVPTAGDQPRTRLAIASMALLLAGFWLVHLAGTVLSTSTPRATTGVACFAAGALLFWDAATHHSREQERQPRWAWR